MKEVPLSPIQEQFWLLESIYPGNTAYNIPNLIMLNGIPDRSCLQKAVNKIIDRHEILRASFHPDEDQVNLRLFEKGSRKMDVSWIEKPETWDEQSLPEFIMDEVHRPFDLSSWPLFRVSVYLFPDTKALLLVNFHHIITDLHSKTIFFEELSRFYNEFLKESEANADNLPGDYSEFSLWYHDWKGKEDAAEMIRDWKLEFPSENETLDLPCDFPNPAIKNLEGKRIHFSLGKHLSAEIREFARSNSLNSFTVLLTTYAIFLHRLSGQSFVIIGVPLTNRRKEPFKEVFGCFVNIVPVFIDFSDTPSGITVLKRVRMAMLKAHRKQEVPFIHLHEILKNKQSNSNTGLFQAGYTFEPLMNVSFESLTSTPVPIERNGAQLDLFFTFFEEEEGYSCFIEYSSQLFREETARHFGEIFSALTTAYIKNPSLHTNELDMLSEKDAALLNHWNDTDHPFTENICLHEVLERQTVRSPHSIALEWGKASMDYDQFNRHVNKMAHYLISLGVKTGDIVGVCMERSPEMLISIYAILKAGGVYLPVDPNYPPERLKMILDDARPLYVFSNEFQSKNLPRDSTIIYTDGILSKSLSENDSNPELDISSENLAYLIYTSGSTGKPKGVMIEHRSAINKLEWMQRQHPLDKEDTILFKTPVTFDVSVWEIFWWIFNGAKLAILPPGGEKEPEIIIRTVKEHKVSCIIFVPSMFSSFVGFVKANSSAKSLESLKWIIQIGEALSPQLVMEFNELRTTLFNPLMVNTYGPAEATVAVSYYNCPSSGTIDRIPIGKPIANTKLFVINQPGKLQSPGIPGELVITGTNLAREYLNRPGLNSEKFICLTLPNGEVHRAYRTGDLVRWQMDGNLDFIGRTDNQVKIRGFRIELGDIESLLLEHPKVGSAAVIVHGNSLETKTLLAYVTPSGPEEATQEELKDFLSGRLPDAMVPAYYSTLSSMPLNNSGKIDRKALPLPGMHNREELVAPKNVFEMDLLHIWKEILNIEEVSTTSNFFDAGGNSLLAIRIVSKVREKLDLGLLVLDVMQYPTIKQMASFLTAKSQSAPPPSPQREQQHHNRKEGLLKLKEKR